MLNGHSNGIAMPMLAMPMLAMLNVIGIVMNIIPVISCSSASWQQALLFFRRIADIPSPRSAPLSDSMNIHVLLTDYSFLLFAGAAAQLAANVAS